MRPVVVLLLVTIQQYLQLSQRGGGGPGGQPMLQGLMAAFVLPAGLRMCGREVIGLTPNAIRFFSTNTMLLCALPVKANEFVRKQQPWPSEVIDAACQAFPSTQGVLAGPPQIRDLGPG